MDPITLSLLIGGGASLLGGLFSSSAADKAATVQEKTAQQALELQKAQYLQSRVDSAPWMDAGRTALGAYMNELGFAGFTPSTTTSSPTTTTTAANGNTLTGAKGGTQGTGTSITTTTTPGSSGVYQGFQATPGYQFQVDQAEKGAVNNLSALGMKNSGAALQALTKLRSGLANSEYGNYLNRLASTAGMGQAQVNSTTAANQNSVLNQGQLLQDAGAARASGYVGGANAMNGALSNFSNNAGNWLGNYNQNWQYAG